MALTLPTHTLAELMPQPSSSHSDCRIVISPDPRPQVLVRHRDAHLYGYEGLSPISSPLSPEESEDDMPMSPIVFSRNEEHERMRFSYVGPRHPRSASTPTSPIGAPNLSPISPITFAQPNLSSPSIKYEPLPAFPSTGTLSLSLRIKRPLPPLPGDVIDDDDDADYMSPGGPTSAHSGSSRPSPSSSDDRDSDSVSSFSPASASSRSSATSIPFSGSSDSIGSSRAVEAFPAAETKLKALAPLIIPPRSHSHSYPLPLPAGPAGPVPVPAVVPTHITSPHISVTPASPLPPQRFGFDVPPAPRQRSLSSTSLVLASPHARPASPVQVQVPRAVGIALPSRSLTPDISTGIEVPARSASPTPSLTPSIAASTISVSNKGGMATLRRITSRARLFGRRTLSSASEPWDLVDDDETVVGHGTNSQSSSSHSLDDRTLRPGLKSRQGTGSSSTLSLGCGGAELQKGYGARRVEIAEVTRTPEGDVWVPVEIEDIIQKLRDLKLPSKLRT